MFIIEYFHFQWKGGNKYQVRVGLTYVFHTRPTDLSPLNISKKH